MSGLRMLATIILSSLLVVVGNASKYSLRIATVQAGKLQNSNLEMKVLAEGLHASLEKPFIVVVRDSGTYERLRKLESSLPKLESDFFETNVTLAAFLGERNTGGFGIQISREGSGGIHINEIKPDKDMMVTQMITTPFKAVAIKMYPAETLAVSYDEPWEKGFTHFQLTSGTFQSGGGFAGLGEQFELKGWVRVMRAADLVTFNLSLLSAGGKTSHSLVDVASGITDKDNQVKVEVLGAGSLMPSPHGALKGQGSFTRDDEVLRLDLVSFDSKVADGYSGRGSFEAKKSSTGLIQN